MLETSYGYLKPFKKLFIRLYAWFSFLLGMLNTESYSQDDFFRMN